MNRSPTPYPDVNAILSVLFADAQVLLQDQLIGMYLHGSLANVGFDAHSDIDMIFTTQEAVSNETFSALRAMHMEIAKIDSTWAKQLEVAYIPQNALRRVDHSHILYPAMTGTLHEWWLPMLDEPAWLREHESVYRAFAVITMYRVLHALQYGTLASKPKATAWSQTQLEASWKRLIDKALAVSQHKDSEVPLDGTLDFIRITIEQSIDRHSLK